MAVHLDPAAQFFLYRKKSAHCYFQRARKWLRENRGLLSPSVSRSHNGLSEVAILPLFEIRAINESHWIHTPPNPISLLPFCSLTDLPSAGGAAPTPAHRRPVAPLLLLAGGLPRALLQLAAGPPRPCSCSPVACRALLLLAVVPLRLCSCSSPACHACCSCSPPARCAAASPPPVRAPARPSVLAAAALRHHPTNCAAPSAATCRAAPREDARATGSSP